MSNECAHAIGGRDETEFVVSFAVANRFFADDLANVACTMILRLENK